MNPLIEELNKQITDLVEQRSKIETEIWDLQKSLRKLEQELLGKQGEDIRNFLEDHSPIEDDWLEAIGFIRVSSSSVLGRAGYAYKCDKYMIVPDMFATDEDTDNPYELRLMVASISGITLVVVNTRHELVMALLGLKIDSAEIRARNARQQ